WKEEVIPKKVEGWGMSWMGVALFTFGGHNPKHLLPVMKMVDNPQARLFGVAQLPSEMDLNFGERNERDLSAFRTIAVHRPALFFLDDYMIGGKGTDHDGDTFNDNVGISFVKMWGKTEATIGQTAAHEIGHLLGLHHIKAVKNLMEENP